MTPRNDQPTADLFSSLPPSMPPRIRVGIGPGGRLTSVANRHEDEQQEDDEHRQVHAVGALRRGRTPPSRPSGRDEFESPS